MTFEEQQELTKRLVSEDELAFEEIFEQDKNRYFNLVYGMIYDSEEAKDILQTSFLKLWKHRLDIKIEQGYTKWLYRCVINTTFDALRRKKVRSKPFSDLSEENLCSLKDKNPSINELQQKEDEAFLQKTIQKALQGLDEKYRIVIILRFWEKMPYREIGELLNIPPGTAGRRFTVGMGKLENLLEHVYQKE